MYKRIDIEGENQIKGYSFVDEGGMVVYATIPYKQGAYNVKYLVDVGVEDDGTASFTIYKHDIPKLIKTLEAAYNHKEG